MIHELRIYEIFEANKAAFHARFRDHAARLMRAKGFSTVAMWEAEGAKGPEFVYVLAWPDEATRKAAWQDFMGDEEWQRIKRDTAAEHGDLVNAIETRVMRLVDYSPGLSA